MSLSDYRKQWMFEVPDGKKLIESSPNLRLLCPESEGFPANLLQIHSVPAVLYVNGELLNAHNLCLGSGIKVLYQFRKRANQKTGK